MSGPPRQPSLARSALGLLGRWYVALACVIVLAGVVLLPGLGDFGLWEPQERQLSDRIAPREQLVRDQADAAKKLEEQQDSAQPQATLDQQLARLKESVRMVVERPPIDPCLHQAPKDALARSLTGRATAWGRDHVGDSDGGRRMPLAILGLLTVLATAGIAMRGSGSRAGVFTTLIMISMPLLVLQSRQLTSEIGTAAGAALTLYGLVAFGRWSLLGALEAVVALVALSAGLVLGFLSGGALLGVVVPVGAYAAAGGLAIPSLRPLARAGIRMFRWVAFKLLGRKDLAARPTAEEVPLVDHIKVLVATFAVIAVIGVLAYQLYDLREPQPGLVPPQRALFGKAIVPNGCWSSALGAIWRPDDDLRYIYDSTFEQIAYGTFPWGILAPIAIASLIASADRKRRQVGALALGWAGGAWIASEAFNRKVGFSLWAGFPALALAIGVWLDGVLAGRARGDREAMPRGAALIGLFVAIAVLDLGKDMQSFSERVTSMLVGNDGVPYPTMSKLLWLPTKTWILIIGLYVALGFVLTMALWRDDRIEGIDEPPAGRRAFLREVALGALVVVFLPIALPVRLFLRPGRPKPALYRMAAQTGLAAAIAFTLLMGLYWAFIWQPMLATHLSSKAMFDTYLDLRKPGDKLVLMGDLGDAPYDYAPDAKAEVVQSREQIVAALGRTNRVFAIAPETERCQLHREIGGKPYFVIDDRNQRSWLLSNKVDGTTDKNPLAATIVHSEPKNIPIRPKGRVVFDNRVELLGWDMPRSVDRGAKFEVKMYYKVLQPVGGTWTILFHFDGPLRFNGDHPPIDGLCQTSTWQKDDYIIDTHTVIAGGSAFAPGKYEVWTGFFSGSAPNWKNMPVSEAPGDMRDTVDRVKITAITLD